MTSLEPDRSHDKQVSVGLWRTWSASMTQSLQLRMGAQPLEVQPTLVWCSALRFARCSVSTVLGSQPASVAVAAWHNNDFQCHRLAQASRHFTVTTVTHWLTVFNFKADSHIACRAHSVPLPRSDSAVSFVEVRVVAGNIRSASPTISLFHREFFNSIMDKTPTHALFYSTLY